MGFIEETGFQQHRYALNRFQLIGDFHPFTCANRSDHPNYDGLRDRGLLIATDEGWRCPFCDYRQDWAHAGMEQAPRAFALIQDLDMKEHWKRLSEALEVQICRAIVSLHRMRREARHPEVVDVLLEDARAVGVELRDLKKRVDR